MKEENVILVDNFDSEIGIAGKLEAHKNKMLHRALSVFICNSSGEWLMQRRALGKYHSGGLWSNACCSHPKPGESVMEAAQRRLKEELGIESNLTEIFSFVYMEPVGNNLTEHEFDHVFFGISDQLPETDPAEVMEWKYMNFSDLNDDILRNPEKFTVWLRKSFERVNHAIEQKIDTSPETP